jgi:aminoglycoside 6'-N-acetyltransferase I
MSTISIRRATSADHERWAAMRIALWPDCAMEKQRIEIEQVLASDGVVFLAEHMVEGPVGFAEVSIRREHVEGVTASPAPYLEGWYVDASHRGCGVGRLLIAAVEDWARDAGFCELASDVELENIKSQHAHESLGFREVGRGVQYVKKL